MLRERLYHDLFVRVTRSIHTLAPTLVARNTGYRIAVAENAPGDFLCQIQTNCARMHISYKANNRKGKW